MKNTIFIIFLGCLVFYTQAGNYTIVDRISTDSNLIYSVIRDSRHVPVAKICLIETDPFFLYSSDTDPDVFPDIEKNIAILTARKKHENPTVTIMIDFSNQPKVQRSIFNIKYFVRYLMLISFAPPYLRKVEILSPYRSSRIFFIEMKRDKKIYYGAVDFNQQLTDADAKKFINRMKIIGEIITIIPVLDNIPIKLVNFDGRKETLYESCPGHNKFTCVLINNKN